MLHALPRAKSWQCDVTPLRVRLEGDYLSAIERIAAKFARILPVNQGVRVLIDADDVDRAVTGTVVVGGDGITRIAEIHDGPLIGRVYLEGDVALIVECGRAGGDDVERTVAIDVGEDDVVGTGH